MEGDVIHEAEDAAARGCRDPHAGRVKHPQSVRRQALRLELTGDGINKSWSQRDQVRLAHIGGENRTQRPRVGQQKTLPAIDPEKIRAPVIIARRRPRGRKPGAAEQLEQPPRATNDHQPVHASFITRRTNPPMYAISGYSLSRNEGVRGSSPRVGSYDFQDLRDVTARLHSLRCSAPSDRRRGPATATAVQPTGAPPSALDAGPPIGRGARDRSCRDQVPRRGGARPRTGGTPGRDRRAGCPWRGSRMAQLRSRRNCVQSWAGSARSPTSAAAVPRLR